MIVQSLITLFIVQLITLIAISIVIKLLFRIPPNEMILILFCLISEFFGYLFYSVNYYYSTSSSVDQNTIIFARIGYFFSIVSIMLVTYAIIFIDFKANYQNIIELLIFSWVSGANAVFNAVTFEIKLDQGSLHSIYNPLGVILVISFFSLVMYIWIKRFLRIAKIYRLQNTFTNALRSLSLFIIIGTTLVLLYMFFVVIYEVHGDYSFVAGGFVTIVGMGILVRNNAFLFITDIQFDSLLIVEKISGIRLYSKIFEPNIIANEDDSDFLGSIISAINITFSDTIHSNKDLTEMSFSNKTVLIYTGEYVRSILILSSSNLIAKAVSKHVVKNFEKLFGEHIESNVNNNMFVSRKNDYLAFEKEVDYIRQFIPL